MQAAKLVFVSFCSGALGALIFCISILPLMQSTETFPQDSFGFVHPNTAAGSAVSNARSEYRLTSTSIDQQQDAFKGNAIGTGVLTDDEQVQVTVYEGTNRSVVNIQTVTFVRDFFNVVPEAGAGSGWVFDQKGHIVTNYHVVGESQRIQVTLSDGSAYKAEVVGTDPPNDIAVLKIDAPEAALFPVTLGDSSVLKVGQKVLAIGNPFGLERTLTVGIVSSLNRTLRSPETGRIIKSVIQIDAALNSGNSGGPLLDSRAVLIGMNTAILSKSGENAGIGLAIPSNTIARVVDQILQFGRVIRPTIGVALTQSEQGLRIIQVEPGGAADRAGLKGYEVKIVRTNYNIYQVLDPTAADVVVSVEGKKVSTEDEFLTRIEEKKPGDSVVIGILRNGQLQEARLTLDADHVP